MKVGDLVVLKELLNPPGALTAIKFYKRLFDEIGNRHMIILEIHNPTAVVLVNGYKKVLNLEFLEAIDEIR